MKTSKFDIYNIAITLLLIAVAAVIKNFTSLFVVSMAWPVATAVFFAALTRLVYALAVAGLKSSGSAVPQLSILGGMGIRMIFSLLFITVYLIASDTKDIFFIAYFLCAYLFYTMFEIYVLVINLRPGLKK